MCIFCKIDIFVGLQVFFNIDKAIFNLAGRIENACAEKKGCASEEFCIRRALYKRLSDVQIG